MKNDGKDVQSMLGDPRSAIRRMILPFLISIVTIQINIFADTFWVSGLGIEAVSGMTTAVPIYSIFTNIAVGLSVGVVATIAYRIGKRDLESASDIAGNAIVTGIALSIACSLAVFLLMDPIVDLMGAQDVRQQVSDYTMPFILMSPLVVLNTIFGGLLRAEGSARRSTIVQMSAAVFNMILDPILIYELDLGLAGAGLATTIAAGMGLMIGIHWYLRKDTAIGISRKNLRLKRDAEKDLMNVAGPRTVEGLTMTVVILFQRVFIIMASGTPGVSLFNVPFRYVTLSMCPSEATGMAMVPVASASYGQSDVEKMSEAMMYALKVAIAISVAMMVILFVFSEPLITMFTLEPSMEEWKEAFVWNMRVYCLILPFFTIQTIGSSMLQSMKRSKRPMEVTMIVGVIRMLLFWLCSAYDYQAITYALIASYVISAAMMAFFAKMEFDKIKGKISKGAAAVRSGHDGALSHPEADGIGCPCHVPIIRT